MTITAVAVAASSAASPPRAEAQVLGPIVGATCPILEITCQLSLLEYKWRTVYRRANGTELTRTTPALAIVPALINADDDLLPDILGTVLPLSLTRFQLRIDRAPLEGSALPVRIEALISGPPGGQLAGKTIAAGFDVRDGRTPGSEAITLELLDTNGDGKTDGLNVTANTTNPGTKLPLTAELFSGTPELRTESTRLKATLSPVPSTLGARVEFAPSTNEAFGGAAVERVKLTLSSSQRVRLDGEFATAKPDKLIAGTAAIDQLPTSATLVFDETAEAVKRRQVTWRAGQTVGTLGGKLTITPRVPENAPPSTTVDVTATGLPTKLDFTQEGKLDVVVDTLGSGAITRIDGGLAGNGPIVPLTHATGSGARGLSAAGGRFSYVARADGIKRLELDAPEGLTAPVVIDAQMARQVFVADLDQQDIGRTIDGTLDTLPAHARVTMDLGAGTVGWDGFGETIGRIDVLVDDDTPLFDRIRHIDGKLRGLPPKVDVAFKAPDGSTGMSLISGVRIDSVEAFLTSGPEKLEDGTVPSTLVPADQTGAVFEEVATRSAQDRLVVFGRVRGLKRASFRTEPSEKQGDKLLLGGEFDAGRVTAVARRRLDDDGEGGAEPETLKADAVLESFPGTADLTLDLPAGVIGYDGAGSISRLDVEATAEPQLFDKVRKVDAEIKQFPAGADVSFATPGADPAVSFSARGGEVGAIDALVTSDTALTREGVGSGGIAGVPGRVPAGEPGALLHADLESLTAFGRVSGLREMRFGPTPGKDPEDSADDGLQVIARIKPGPFTASGHLVRAAKEKDAADIDLVANARVGNVPGDAVVDIDLGLGTVVYTGDATIGLIEADALQSVPFFGPVRNVRARIDEFAPNATLAFADPDRPGTVTFTASERIGAVEATLASGASNKTRAGVDPRTLVPQGHHGAVLELIDEPGTDDDSLLAHGRVRDLRSFTFADESPAPAPGVPPAKPRLHVLANVASAPLTAHALIVEPDEKDEETVETTADATIRDLPADPDLLLDLGAGNVVYTAGARIGEIVLDATSTAPLVKRMNEAHLTIKGFPESTTLRYLPVPNPLANPLVTEPEKEQPLDVDLAATKTIDQIDVLLTNGVRPQIEAGVAGATLIDRIEPVDIDQQAVAARIFGLRHAAVRQDPASGELVASAEIDPGRFVAHAEHAAVPVGEQRAIVLTGDATLDRTPPTWTTTVTPVAGTSTTRVVYDAAGVPINSIVADITRNSPFFAGITHIHGELGAVPGNATVNITSASATTGTAVSFDSDVRIGTVEALLSKGQTLLADGRDPRTLVSDQGAVVEDLPNSLLVYGKVRGLRSAGFSTDAAGVINVDANLNEGVLAATLQRMRPGAGDLRAFVELDRFPGVVENVTYDPNAATVHYKGGGTIDTIEANVERDDKPFFDQVTDIIATVTGFPSDATVQLDTTPDAKNILFSSTQRVGSIEALLSSGPKLLVDGTRPQDVIGNAAHGAVLERIKRTGDAAAGNRTLLFGKVFGLKHFSLAEGGPDGSQAGRNDIEADVGAGRAVLQLHDDADVALDPALPETLTHVVTDGDGEIDRIPSGATNIRIDPSRTSRYSASADINSIELNLHRNIPYFDRVKRIDGKVRGLPRSVSVQAQTEKGRFAVKSVEGNSVDSVEVLLSDGQVPSEDLTSRDAGIVLEDTPERFAIRGRLNGLRDASVFDEREHFDRITASLDTDGGPILARIKTAEEKKVVPEIGEPPRDPVRHDFSATARIEDLPGAVDVTLKPDAGHVTYTGDAAIDAIDVDLSSNIPFFGLIKHIDARIEQFPIGVVVNYKPNNLGVVKLSASPEPVGMVDASFDSGKIITPLALESDNGVAYERGATTERIRARLHGLRSALVDTDGDKLVGANLNLAQSVPFVATVRDATRDVDPALPFSARLEIADVPSTVGVELRRPATSGGPTHIEYNANALISRISLRADNVAPLMKSDDPGGADVIEAEVRDLPTHLEADIQSGCTSPATGEPCGSLIRLDTEQATGDIGAVSMRLGRRQLSGGVPTDPFADLPSSWRGALPRDNSGVDFRQVRNSSGQLLAPTLAAEIHDLRRAKVDVPDQEIRALMDVNSPTGTPPSSGANQPPHTLNVDLETQAAGDEIPTTIDLKVQKLVPDMIVRFDSGASPGCNKDARPNCRPTRLTFSSDRPVGEVTLDMDDGKVDGVNDSSAAMEEAFPRKINMRLRPSTEVVFCSSPLTAHCTNVPTENMPGVGGTRDVDSSFRVESQGVEIFSMCLAVRFCVDKSTHLFLSGVKLEGPDGVLEYAGRHKLLGFARLRASDDNFTIGQLRYHNETGIVGDGDRDFFDIERVLELTIPEPGADLPAPDHRKVVAFPFLDEGGDMNCPEDVSVKFAGKEFFRQLCGGGGVIG